MSIMIVMLLLLQLPKSENVHAHSHAEPQPHCPQEAPLYDCGQFGFTFPWTNELHLHKECTCILTVMGNE